MTRTALILYSCLAACGLALVQPAAGDTRGPLTERAVAALIDEALSRPVIEPYSLTMLRDAEILDIDLIHQETVTQTFWVADIDLEADFGPVPNGVIGFEPIRSQRYRLYVTLVDGDVKLERFTPIAEAEKFSTGY